MEQGQRSAGVEDVYEEVHAILDWLDRKDETTWSYHIAHTLNGSSVAEVFPLLRHELCGLRRSPVGQKAGLDRRLDALIAVLNEALLPYGYRPEPCGATAPSVPAPAAGRRRLVSKTAT
jgi:hypothetical protein